MADNVRKVLTVFLASPGDLADERRLVKKHVEEWNEVNSARENWIVELLGWEDTLPQAGRPQALINRDVQRCALFIGMMWKRWGTRPGGPDSDFTSGFEEEYELASARYVQEQLPQLAMFFKDPGSTEDAGPALKKVLAFKQKLISEKRVYYKEFPDDPQAWDDHFRRILHRLIFEQIAALDAVDADRLSETQSESPITPDEEAGNGREPETSDEWQFAKVKKVLADFGSRGSEAELSDLDVARLRLAALAIRRPALSDTHLETHDANLLFKGRNDLSLSGQEMKSLVDAALESWPIDVMPLWGWVPGDAPLLQRYFRHRALQHADQSAIGALRVLTIIGDPIAPELRPQLHTAFAEASAPYRNQALAYFNRVGTSDDLAAVDAEVAKGDFATKETALKASLAIRGRISSTSPLEYLIGSSVDAPLLRSSEGPLKAAAQLDEGLLRQGLSHRTEAIRSTCARALREQGKLSDDEITRLKSDAAAGVRLEAVLADIERGAILTVADADRIITPPRSLSAGALSLFGSDRADRERRIAAQAICERLNDQALLDASIQLYYPAEIAYEVRARRHFAKLADDVRSDIDDRFARYFDKAIQLLESRLGAAAAQPIIQHFNEKLREFRVGEMLKRAGRLLGEKGGASDAERIGTLLLDGTVRLDDQYLNFLKRWGGQGDIALINACLTRNTGILQISTDETIAQSAASAVYALAKKDLPLLVEHGLRGSLIKDVVGLAEKKRFSALSDAQLLSLLLHDDEDVRRASAIKVAGTKTKSAITKLMDAILDRPTYYYNTIHWLDFGRSVPRNIVLKAESWNAGS